MISAQIDFRSIDWQATPVSGVFYFCVEEEKYPVDKIPVFTSHAVRIDPGHGIGLHYHKREREWTELLFFPNGGNFEFLRGHNSKHYSGPDVVYERIKSFEVYGIRNMASDPLCFFSIMKPGFTGFEEIVPVE